MTQNIPSNLLVDAFAFSLCVCVCVCVCTLKQMEIIKKKKKKHKFSLIKLSRAWLEKKKSCKL